MEPSREDALKKLKELNVILEFENIKAFHGRATKENENFVVKDNVDNTLDILGHYNINNVAGLFATDFSHAQKYADFRVEEEYKKTQTILKPKVFEIVPKQSGLLVFDLTKIEDIEELDYFFHEILHLNQNEITEIEKNCLTHEEQQKLKAAISELVSCHSVLSLMPELFETKQDVKNLKDLTEIIKQKEKKTQNPLITDQELEAFIKKTKQQKNDERICEICGAINSYEILKSGDIKTMFSKFQSDFDFCEDCALNLKLMKSFLEKENIVGVKQKLWNSDNIKEQNFDTFFFFNTKQIGTTQNVKKIERDKQKQEKTF